MVSFDLKNPIAYAFKNGAWKKTFLVGTLFLLINASYNYYKTVYFNGIVPDSSQMLFYWILTVLNTVLYMFVLGYFFINSKSRINKPQEPLAEWNDWKGVFFTGFKASMAYLIYSLPVLVIYIFTVFAPQMQNFTYGTPYQPNIVILCSIAFLTFLLNTIGVVLYSGNLKFSSFFNPKLFYNLVLKKFPSFLVLFLIFLLISGIDILFLKLAQICVYTIIIKAFVSFYLLVVKSDFTAQFLNEES